jgi:hypothetical protein
MISVQPLLGLFKATFLDEMMIHERTAFSTVSIIKNKLCFQ